MTTGGRLRQLARDRFTRGLAVAAGAGLLVRWWVVVVARPTCGRGETAGCFRINGDAAYHFTQGRMIGDGRFFKNGLVYEASGRVIDSAGDPPLFAGLLGAWSFLGFDTVQWQRFLLTFVGAATVVLVGLLARRLAGDTAGWVAAGIAAVHPLLWINDAMLMSESLYQPVLVVVLLAAARYAEAPGMRAALVVGALVGSAALVRGEAALLGIVLLGPLVLLVPQLARAERVRQLAASGAVALVVISPWVVYNNIRFEDPVTLTAASGSVLMAGSCDEVWSGPNLGFWADCFTLRGLRADYEASFPGGLDAGADRVLYDESLIDTYNREQALDYIGDHLGRYPVVAMARVGRALELFRVGDTLRWNWELEGRWRAPSTVGLALYYALLVPAAAGAWVLARRGRRLTPLLAMWPYVIVTAALTFGLTRYRVPVDLAMIVLSAVAAAALVERSPAKAAGP